MKNFASGQASCRVRKSKVVDILHEKITYVRYFPQNVFSFFFTSGSPRNYVYITCLEHMLTYDTVSTK